MRAASRHNDGRPWRSTQLATADTYQGRTRAFSMSRCYFAELSSYGGNSMPHAVASRTTSSPHAKTPKWNDCNRFPREPAQYSIASGSAPCTSSGMADSIELSRSRAMARASSYSQASARDVARRRPDSICLIAERTAPCAGSLPCCHSLANQISSVATACISVMAMQSRIAFSRRFARNADRCWRAGTAMATATAKSVPTAESAVQSMCALIFPHGPSITAAAAATAMIAEASGHFDWFILPLRSDSRCGSYPTPTGVSA